MKTIFVFSPCSCVAEGLAVIKGYIFKRFDNDSLYFREVCLNCGLEANIKQPIDEMEIVEEGMAEFDKWLDLPESDILKFWRDPNK